MDYRLRVTGKILEFLTEKYREIMPKSSKTRHKNMLTKK